MKRRVQLDHGVHYAGRSGAVYFITICCAFRGTNQLCTAQSSRVIFESARIYHNGGKWDLLLMILMPDHLHALISVNGETSLGNLVRNFKRITAKMAEIRWQRNFFDHRIRASEGATKKAFYVSNNPVRAGLASCAEDWPYQLGTLSITNVIDQ